MKLHIAIDGQMYEVEVEVAEDDYRPQMQDNRPTPAATTIQSVVLRTPHKTGSSLDPDNHEAKLCRSPLAGIVVHVPVAPGQYLQVNDLMVLLEAMKMETAVTAPVEGNAETGQSRAGRVGEGKPGAGRIRLTSCPSDRSCAARPSARAP